jgi:hypothetical protein
MACIFEDCRRPHFLESKDSSELYMYREWDLFDFAGKRTQSERSGGFHFVWMRQEAVKNWGLQVVLLAEISDKKTDTFKWTHVTILFAGLWQLVLCFHECNAHIIIYISKTYTCLPTSPSAKRENSRTESVHFGFFEKKKELEKSVTERLPWAKLFHVILTRS